MKPVILCLGLLVLAACGADGDPIVPTKDSTLVQGIGGTAVNVELRDPGLFVGVSKSE